MIKIHKIREIFNLSYYSKQLFRETVLLVHYSKKIIFRDLNLSIVDMSKRNTME